jgi:hypothetical protein
MQTKLTLRLDDLLIEQAKTYAKRSGKSVSQLVAEYFSLLHTSSPAKTDLSPSVEKLKGALKKSKTRIEDYHEYLEEKHL